MFKDQKNINIRVIGWLLLAIFAAHMHYLCVFIYFDIYHIDYFVDLSFIGLKGFWINDIFPFFNAPKNVHLDVQYYLYFIGMRLNTCILAYLLLSAVKTLNVLMDTIVRRFNFYQKIYLFIKVYLLVQIYSLLNYILFAGQFLKGVPLLVYGVLVLLIFFVHKGEAGWRIRAEL